MKVAFIIDKRPNKQGTHAIKLKIAYKSKEYFEKTPFRCKKSQFKDGRLKGSTDNARKINAWLNEREANANFIIAKNPQITPDRLKQLLSGGVNLDSPTIEELLPKFLERYTNEGTIKSRRSMINQFCVYAPDTLITEIDTEWLQGAINYFREQGNSNVTITGKLKKFSTLLNYAVDKELIKTNPVDKIQKPKGQSKKPFSLTYDEFVKFRDVQGLSSTEEVARDIFLLQVYCEGIRIADALKLNREHIFNDVIRYSAGDNKKHNKESTTYITKPLRELINKYDSYRIVPLLHKDDFASINARIAFINKKIKLIARLAGIKEWKRLTTHSARHTYAMLLADKNVPITLIQQRLGHSNTSMTDTYLKSLKRDENEDILRDLFE